MQTRNANYNTIHPDRLVLDWPKEIVNRQRSSDWEGDTVYGSVGKGRLVTLVDRKTRFPVAGLLPKKEASSTRKVVSSLPKDLPVQSITFDNGSEFAEFHGVEEDLKTWVRGWGTFFAELYYIFQTHNIIP